MILDKIDSPEKEILILYFFEGFRLKEIATILDMNENTVKTKMYRSLNALRQILEWRREECHVFPKRKFKKTKENL